MLELPVLNWTSSVYDRPKRSRTKFSDFEDLPAYFHERIRSFIRTEVPCIGCTALKCSCSGGNRAQAIFLPGERAWIEMRVPNRFRGDDPNSFPLAGDCTQLVGIQCSAGYYKPFDCISFPFQPVTVNGELVPAFAKNCSFHPADMDPIWIHERWKAWQYIHSVIPDWVEVYATIPPQELPCV